MVFLVELESPNVSQTVSVHNLYSQYRSSTYNGRMYNQKGGPAEDRLFKRPTIVKDRDIEDLGHKAASRDKNDDSSMSPNFIIYFDLRLSVSYFTFSFL